MILEIAGTAVAIMGGVAVGPSLKAKVASIKLPSLKRQKKADELFPGVVRPSVIAIDLICSRIIKGDWAALHTKPTENWDERRARYLSNNLHKWSDGVVSFEYSRLNMTSDRSFNFVRIGEKNIDLTPSTAQKLSKAIDQAIEISGLRIKAEKEAAAEQAALDGIEILMGLEQKQLGKEQASAHT